MVFVFFLRHKIEAKLSTLKLNLSDEKLSVLFDFYKHIPMPHSNSMMGLDDSVDGHLMEPVTPVMVCGVCIPFLLDTCFCFSIEKKIFSSA